MGEQLQPAAAGGWPPQPRQSQQLTFDPLTKYGRVEGNRVPLADRGADGLRHFLQLASAAHLDKGSQPVRRRHEHRRQ